MFRIYPARRLQQIFFAVLVVLVAVVISGCSHQVVSDQKIAGDSLAIFSGLPLSGPLGPVSESMVKAEKLALAENKSKIGKLTISYTSLNDADPGGLKGGLQARNARRVAREGKAIAYIGGLTSAASRTALPILNQDDILAVSPTSSAVGLTKVYPGALENEPETYYISGKRNFVRLAPGDNVLAKAAASWTKSLKVKRALALNDGTVYGKGITELFVTEAKKIGIEIDTKTVKVGSKARVESRAELVFYGGAQSEAAAKTLRSLSTGPSLKLMALEQDGVGVPRFYSELGSTQGSTYVVSPVVDSRQLSSKLGREFVKDYQSQFKQQPLRQAVYAYTAVKLIQGAIKRAGADGSDRRRVIEEILETENFKTPLGKITIDENGDSNLRDVGGFTLSNGRLVFEKALKG